MRTLAHAGRGPGCSRSTRSTCSSARTTCRCSRGWGPTTPTCCAGPRSSVPRRMVEYWAHVQAFMPVELWPVMQHRMAPTATAAASGGRASTTRPELVAPCCAASRRARRRDRPRPRRRRAARAKEHWGWNWSEARKALDYLFLVGDARRRGAHAPVRARLRPARAGAPARRCWRCRRRPRPMPPRAGPSSGPVARRGHRSLPGRLLPDAAASAARARGGAAADRRPGRGR